MYIVVGFIIEALHINLYYISSFHFKKQRVNILWIHLKALTKISFGNSSNIFEILSQCTSLQFLYLFLF